MEATFQTDANLSLLNPVDRMKLSRILHIIQEPIERGTKRPCRAKVSPRAARIGAMITKMVGVVNLVFRQPGFEPGAWMGQPNLGARGLEQPSLDRNGWRVRNPPAAGEVFFLDSPSPETSLRFSKRDLEAEFGYFLFEEVDLLSAVSVLVVLSAFVDTSLTVLQHSIDQAGESVGHRRNGLRST